MKERRRVLRGLVEVLIDPQAERVVRREVAVVDDVHVGAEPRAEVPREVGARRDGGDAGEVAAQQREAGGVDGGRVAEGGVEIARAAQVGPEWRRRGVVDDGLDGRRGEGGGDVERAEGAAVGRDLRVAQPRAVGVPEEVVAGADGAVHAGSVEAGDRLGRERRAEGEREGERAEARGNVGSSHRRVAESPTRNVRRRGAYRARTGHTAATSSPSTAKTSRRVATATQAWFGTMKTGSSMS